MSCYELLLKCFIEEHLKRHTFNTFKHEWCFSEAHIRFRQLNIQVRMNPGSIDSQRKGQSIWQAMNIFSFFQFLRSSHTISMSKHELSLSHLLWQTEETCKCLKCNISQFSVTLFDLLHRLKITKTGFSRPVTGCCSWRTSYNNSREAISSGTMQRNSKSQRFDCRFRAQTLLLHTAVGD